MKTLGGATELMYACQQCKEHEVLDILTQNSYLAKDRDRTLKTPLHYCAENPSTACAETLLQFAPELVNTQDENGYCPLHLAVIAGNKPLIKFLLSKGADVNLYDNEGHSAVHWAIVSSEKEALEIIMEAGANPSTPDIHGGYPLHYAVQMCGSGNDSKKSSADAVKVVQTLLKYEVDVNVTDKDGRQPILWAASAGSAEAIIHLISHGARVHAADKDGLTALHCAASRGHRDCIETLINLCGADVDIIDGNGCSSLFYSVTLGHADSTETLLKLGAQANLQDRKGRTPAHCGAAKGQVETLRILQNHDGNLWVRNVKGDLPFHEAVASGRKDLVLWLLEQNPEVVNIGNNDGRCPLHIAAMYNDSEMIKLLLEAKSLVNPIMRTSKGVLMTPLNVALCKGHRSCGKFLQLHGGVPFSKVSKLDTNFVDKVRVLHPDSVHEVVDWSEEIVSPSFKVIHTSLDPIDDVKMQGVEKKKVYRRRKKRRSLSDEKKINENNTDSEDSANEVKVRVQARRTSSKSYNSNDHEGTNENEREARERKMSLKNGKESDAITSIIFMEGNNYISAVEKESIELVHEITNDPATEFKSTQRTESLNEYKSASKITSDDFPSPVQSTTKLNSELNETLKSPITSENATPEINLEFESPSEPFDGKNKYADLNDVKEIDNNEGKEDKNLLSPSFRILDKTDSQEERRIFTTENTTINQNKNDSRQKSNEDVKNKTAKSSKKVSGKKGLINYSDEGCSNGNSIKKIDVTKEFNEADVLPDEKSLKHLQKKNNDKGIEASMDAVSEDVAEISLENKSSNEESVDRCQEKENGIRIELEKGLGSDQNLMKYKSDNGDLREVERVDLKQSSEIKDDIKKPEDASGVMVERHQIGNDINLIEADSNSRKLDLIQNEIVFVEVRETENPINFPENNPINNPEKRDVEELSIAKADSEKLSEDNNLGDDVLKVSQQTNICLTNTQESESNLEVSHIDSNVTDKISLQKSGSNEQFSDITILAQHDNESVITSNQSASESEKFVGPASGIKSDIVKSSSESNINDIKSYNDGDGNSRREHEKNNESLPSLHIKNDEISTDCKKKNKWITSDRRFSKTTRISRLCRRNKDFIETNQISVNQLVQGTIRKYHLERGIFHQLLELKRLQIRAGRANEQVLVKRLVDEYERSCTPLGIRHFMGPFKFKDFEKFLYDQLKMVNNRSNAMIPEIKSYDDIDTLSTILKKSRFKILSELQPYEPTCTCLTQRCHHVTHAYTSVPCSAYIANLHRNVSYKQKRGCFLPLIDHTHKSERYDDRPATLELIQGNDKQIIELPQTTSDKSKKYYITFTINSAQSCKEVNAFGETKDFFKYRHTKSV